MKHLDLNKVISNNNKDKAKVGEIYYFLNTITGDMVNGDLEIAHPDILEDVDYKSSHPFESKDGTHFDFLYPAEAEDEYVTYEELLEYWKSNPTDIYFMDGITGMITGFDDDYKCFRISDRTVYMEVSSEEEKEECYTIRDIFRVNNLPLTKDML